MAMKRVVVNVPLDQLASIQQLVAEGQTASVAAFVQHAIAIGLEDVDIWRSTLDEALDATGGPLTDDERRWADDVLHVDRDPVEA